MAILVESGVGALDGADAIRDRRTTQELVFEFLRGAILSGRLRGGTRLVQDKIAHELNVSRVPVREALLQLEREGLVRMEAHRGASVVWLSPDEIAEIFELRTLLTMTAVRKVAPDLTDDQVNRLEQIARKQETEGSMATRVRLNRVFYATLFENLHSPRLLGMIDRLEREVERYLQPLERPHMGHMDVVEACRDRDGERAARLIGEHLEGVADRAVERVRGLMKEGDVAVPTRSRRRATRQPTNGKLSESLAATPRRTVPTQTRRPATPGRSRAAQTG